MFQKGKGCLATGFNAWSFCVFSPGVETIWMSNQSTSQPVRVDPWKEKHHSNGSPLLAHYSHLVTTGTSVSSSTACCTRCTKDTLYGATTQYTFINALPSVTREAPSEDLVGLELLVWLNC